MKTPGSIQIRIRPGGRIYLDGMNEELLELAAVLNPGDPSLARRLKLLEQARDRAAALQKDKEQEDGHAETGE